MTATTAPPHLWQEAATLLRQLFALFGEPQEIAQSHTLTRAAHKLLSSWLRGAEALMRHLLLIEASALPRQPAPSPASSALSLSAQKPIEAPAGHLKRVITHDPEKPESWRVSFKLFMDRRRPAGMRSAGRRGRRRSTQEQRFLSAWPLAERAEALLRVFNNPAPYAKRLARKLHARPDRAETLTLKPDAHRGVIPKELALDFAAIYAPIAPKRDDSS